MTPPTPETPAATKATHGSKLYILCAPGAREGTKRCRACGQDLKGGFTNHARTHLGARFVIDGQTFSVREMIGSPSNSYSLRREAPDVIIEFDEAEL
jgi:hypothetical protein